MSCKGCFYWKDLDNRCGSATKCCHYLLINGKRRPRDENGNCLGYAAKKEAQKRVNRWIFAKGENA